MEKVEDNFFGIIDVYKKTWNSDGIFGFYRGFIINMMSIMVYRGLYFGLYDTWKYVTPQEYSNSFIIKFFAGSGVTIIAGLGSYPIDTVRRRMMMRSIDAEKYKSSLHCFYHIVTKDGITRLWGGAGLNILRSIAGAATLMLYDTYFSKMHK